MLRFSVFAASLLACVCGFAAQPNAEYDAKFVKMEVPKTVVADQVFSVKITMKNTGTATWKEARDILPSSLRAVSPDNNKTWGTDFIIQGQGTMVAPGKEFTYVANLRAPSEPGKHVFQWRLHSTPGLFGEATPKTEVTVTKREGPAEPKVVIPAAKDGKRSLTFDDFEYAGSFKIPETAGKGGAGFSEFGMTLRNTKDGKRLFLNYTHPEGTLCEVSIPELAKFEKGDATGLKSAEVKKVWGTLINKDKKASANGGMVWDENKKLMYWSYYHGYWTGGDLPVLNATKLDDDGTMTATGSWTVPQQKWHWGGVMRLPKSYADKYTGGASLALGYGGYFSIVAPCSRGPALSAIADPDPAVGRVQKLVHLLGYPEGTAAPRPGDFFNANCTFWNDQPKSRTTGMWSYCDHCRAGVFIDLADAQGYIAFAKLGTGRLGYDYGTITNAGESQYWYFYDTRQLGEVAKNSRKSGSVTPYQVKQDTDMGGMVTGAVFDDEERKLYVLRMSAYAVGREFHPLVHVYNVKK